MTDETYNGWTNRETWLVHLWLSNEEHSYDAAREIVARELPAAVTESALRDFVEEYAYADMHNGPDAPVAGLASDFISHSLARVAWAEIREAFAEE